MHEKIECLTKEFVQELAAFAPDDYLKVKLMMIAEASTVRVQTFLHNVFTLTEEKRPLLIEMK